MQSEEILTPQEVADYLKLSKLTIYLLIKKGKIPGAFKIGNSWRFRRSEIEALGQEKTKCVA